MSRLLSEEEYRKTNAFKIKRWYRGDKDPYIGKVEMKPQEPFVEDVSSMRQRIHDEALLKRNIYDIEHNRKLRAFSKIYSVISVVFVFTLIAILLYVVSYLPPVGNPANPDNNEVARKYIEDGMKDTGAVNIVTGMILDYRAFDTLGESNVLFIATCTVLILLRVDNCSKKKEEEENDERFFTQKTYKWICFAALLFYCLAKTYSFYCGAHHLETGIPLGTPGDILSSGLILPLNICVGMVVACTMYAFYAMFRKGGF